jgi:hypothetical protein
MGNLFDGAGRDGAVHLRCGEPPGTAADNGEVSYGYDGDWGPTTGCVRAIYDYDGQGQLAQEYGERASAERTGGCVRRTPQGL